MNVFGNGSWNILWLTPVNDVGVFFKLWNARSLVMRTKPMNSKRVSFDLTRFVYFLIIIQKNKIPQMLTMWRRNVCVTKMRKRLISVRCSFIVIYHSRTQNQPFFRSPRIRKKKEKKHRFYPSFVFERAQWENKANRNHAKRPRCREIRKKKKRKYARKENKRAQVNEIYDTCR